MPEFATSIRVAAAVFVRLQAASSLSGPRPYLAVTGTQAGAVGFHAEDGRLPGEAKVGKFPHEAALWAGGRLLYVSDNGVLRMSENQMGGNTIPVLDRGSSGCTIRPRAAGPALPYHWRTN